MNTTLFERASRYAYRYNTVKGTITTEHLWQLPLSSTSGFDLDRVAQVVSDELAQLTQRSFVKKASVDQDATADRLEVVKHIIAVKQAEAEERAAASDKARRKAKLLEVLSRKQDESLESLSPEEILKQNEELN